jgi:hypothetical protein
MIGDGSVSVVTYSQKPMSIQFQKPNQKLTTRLLHRTVQESKLKTYRSSWVSLADGQPYLTIPHTNPGFQNNYVGLDAMNNLRKSISGDTEKPKNYQCMALFVCQLMEAIM